MNIELGTDQKLNFETATSMLLVGTCGSGKTYTIKKILKQVQDANTPIDVIYLDAHKSDYLYVKSICGELVNKTQLLKSDELKSLAIALKNQQQFRLNLLKEAGATNLEQIRGRQVKIYTVCGKVYQPDEILCRYEDCLQKFYLAQDLYEEMSHEITLFINTTNIGEYNPKRTIVCLDEFYTSDMPVEIQRLIHNTIKDTVRLGKALHQNIVLSTQRLSQHKDYQELIDLVAVKMYFYPMYEASDYEALFHQKLIHTHRRGTATIKVNTELRNIHVF